MLYLANLRINMATAPNSAEQPSNEIVDSQVETEPAEDIEDVEVLDADNNIDNDNLLENEGRNERLTTPSPVKSRGRSPTGRTLKTKRQRCQSTHSLSRKRKKVKRHAVDEDITSSPNSSASSSSSGRSSSAADDVSSAESGDDSSSDSTNSSSSSSSSSLAPTKKKKQHKSKRKHKASKKLKRFTIISKKDKNKWKLSKNLATCANKHAKKYQSDKDLFDTILKKNPVPSNIDEPPKLDEFMISTLRDSRKPYEETRDKSLKRIHRKIRDVYGPLCRVMDSVEDF